VEDEEDVEVAAAAVGGSGYCSVLCLTVEAAVGEVPEVAGAAVALEVAASEAAEVDLAADLEVEAVSAAAAPAVVGNKFAGLFGTREFC
jgi:hypothetical protein